MIGIDLGSRSVKIVQMQAGKIVSSRIEDTITFYRHYGRSGSGGLYLNLKDLGMENDRIVATGYGKVTLPVENALQIPEIQAHVVGAAFQSRQSDFTLLDIGGQDTKVVQVRNGYAVDFMTNDRCAASSGRYLENMAAVLGISLEEMASYSQDPAELNATCAIFGETEIIARIVEGCSTPSLAAGVNYALYRRVSSMLKKLISPIIVLAGGVARNHAFKEIVARETGRKVIVVAEPQLNGAIGCCVYGEGI